MAHHLYDRKSVQPTTSAQLRVAYRAALAVGYTIDDAKGYATSVVESSMQSGRSPVPPRLENGKPAIGKPGTKHARADVYDRLAVGSVELTWEQRVLQSHIERVTGYKPSDDQTVLARDRYGDKPWYEVNRATQLNLWGLGPFDVADITRECFETFVAFPMPDDITAKGYGIDKIVLNVIPGLPPYVKQFVGAHLADWRKAPGGLWDELKHISPNELASCRNVADFAGWSRRRIQAMAITKGSSKPYPYQGEKIKGSDVIRLVKNQQELIDSAVSLRNCASGEYYHTKAKEGRCIIAVRWTGDRPVAMAEYDVATAKVVQAVGHCNANLAPAQRRELVDTIKDLYAKAPKPKAKPKAKPKQKKNKQESRWLAEERERLEKAFPLPIPNDTTALTVVLENLREFYEWDPDNWQARVNEYSARVAGLTDPPATYKPFVIPEPHEQVAE